MCGYGKVSAAVQMPIPLLYGTRRVQSTHHAHQQHLPIRQGFTRHSGMHFVYRGSPWQKWNELGIHFDAITSTGFMASSVRLSWWHAIAEQAALGTDIYVDP